MTIMPVETTIQMSPRLVDVVRTTNYLSASERLFLAKALLDSLIVDEAETIEEQSDPDEQLPTLEEVVAQIKATPPNPQQIQRATKTVDEVLADWQETPPAEPRLTTEEDEWLTSEEIVRQIQSMTAEPAAFHPATKSIEMWLAEQAINPPASSSLAPSEWEQLWVEFERDLEAFERADAIAEGWSEHHG